jgi:thiosulfate reductase cytochrome b subunit
MKSLYLFPLWVRLWHWTNALLFIILIVSGASLHFASGDGLFAFDTAMWIHNTAGILLTLAWFGFVIGNLFSDNGKHYRIQFNGIFRRIMEQSFYYAVGIFRGDTPPFQMSMAMKFNTLQQLTYIGVVYGLMPLLILSGGLFLFVSDLPAQMFGIGSIWLIAMSHLIVAYLLVLFLLSHIYIITTGDTIFSHLRAMLTGWHQEAEHDSLVSDKNR